jgi:hypothetical protein
VAGFLELDLRWAGPRSLTIWVRFYLGRNYVVLCFMEVYLWAERGRI